MKKFSEQWIREWCDDNGWTDLFIEHCHYWAFPPGAVMPMPLPGTVLKTIKDQKGWCLEEKIWVGAAIATTLIGSTLTYVLASPMPLIAAFTFCAVVVGRMEVEEL
ncbi:hypothetical protein DO97_00060 [Neosynechococcus sphagnicola sy1]|uniref:Uncharacterized protein n=1 Tax=Neosynechococcus sphagnicola sy1 TaxID=1497020 RepID=A0A098TQ26_9CYAN|nr:hypothetical protein [Neosynechococcus sphagnicola]KGF73977.1 hypothetical protein DO97_00060 [Neosynechococcus sphagnicola sy1]